MVLTAFHHLHARARRCCRRSLLLIHEASQRLVGGIPEPCDDREFVPWSTRHSDVKFSARKLDRSLSQEALSYLIDKPNPFGRLQPRASFASPSCAPAQSL